MHISTYLSQLDFPRPRTDSALLVYAPRLTEAAPLVARLTGHGVSDIAEHLERVSLRLDAALHESSGASVTSRLERVLRGDELRAAGKSYTARLKHRLKTPPRTCAVSLVVASAFNVAARADLRQAIDTGGPSRGVLVVRGPCPEAQWLGMEPYFEEVNLHLRAMRAYLTEQEVRAQGVLSL